MKKLAILLILSMLTMSCLFGQSKTAAGHFSLKVKIDGELKDSLGFYYEDATGQRMNKTIFLDKSGICTFEGEISSPQAVYLIMLDKGERAVAQGNNQVMFFIEPANMSFTAKSDDFDKAVITGSKSQDEYSVLEKRKADITKERKALSEIYDKENNKYNDAVKAKLPQPVLDSIKEAVAELHNGFEKFVEQSSKIDFDFIDNHNNSFVAAYLLRSYSSRFTLSKLEGYYNRFTPELKQSSSGKTIYDEIESLRGGSPGYKAFNFSKPDINNKQLTLSDFKGKYVLLDFWATWCVPCRKSFPHVKELYNKYKDKGIEIICIADDDRNIDKWKAAIEKDGIGMWHHILRGLNMELIMKGIKNPEDLDQRFGIHTIPTKILIDPSGMIIGRYGGGGENDEALDLKLEQLFK